MTWAARLWATQVVRLPGLAALVFTVLLAVALAQLTWQLLPAPPQAAWQPMPVSPVNNRAETRKTDIAALTAAHLFGLYQASAPAAPASREVPDTPLNLTLMGILAGTTPDYSRALIAQQNGDEQPYATGEEVTRGVLLQKILADRVLLLRNGQLEILRLEKEKPSTATALPPQGNLAEAEGARALAAVRDEVLRDPSKASEYLRLQPANVNGQLRGYRVYPGSNRAVFNDSGLRAGDLVTSVNGVELNDAGRALQLLGQLAQAPQISMTIERGGQQQTLNLSLQ